ncbi:MAG: 50S ribosomal protein L11 methyltransferase [Bacteroidaceae bacterium]
MKYTEVTFHIEPYSQEASDVLAALLGDIGFETFSETTDGLLGYVQQSLWALDLLSSTLASFPIPCTRITFTYQDAPYQNWNQLWEEEGFQPVIIDNRIVVHDTRHNDVPDMPYDILITPRQAFGTGNHHTTRMLMEWLVQSDLKGKEVVDAGTGTGVLTILCIMRGAQHVLAYDIDEWSVNNTHDNLLLNNIGTAQVEVRLGDSSVLSETDKCDLMMANINRNILINDMPRFVASIRKGGKLLLSGFYEKDIPLLKETAERYGMILTESNTVEHWSMLVFIRL